MSISQTGARAVARGIGALSPRLGAALALRQFAHVARPRPVGPAEQPTMWRASRSTLQIPGLGRTGAEVVAYEWGTGTRVVALAHGWNGRASQFAPLVRELVAEGYRVVALDAPAHGDSPGRHTYLIDWVDGLRALQWRYGRFHAVIGHSFGGLGALVAVADDVVADRLVAVAAPSGADTLLSQFQRTLGYPDSTAAALRRRFAERYFPGEDDPFARLSATGRPLPAGTAALLVHDAGDRAVPFPELARLRRALTGARVIETRGFGHNRVLGADAFLDGVLEFLETPRLRAQGAAPQSTVDTTAA